MKGQKGYTLTEMLVVLLLMSLITAIAPVAVHKLLPSIAVQSATQTLNADLELLRTRSLMAGREGELRVENDGQGYMIIVAEETIKRRTFANAVHFDTLGNNATEYTPLIMAKANGRLSGARLTLVRGNSKKHIVINPVFGTAEIDS